MDTMSNLKVILSVVFIQCVSGDQYTVSVGTNVGEVQGVKGESYSKFLGVPYGYVEETDPLGPARPYPTFKTPYKAIKSPEICPQIFNNTAKGSIHCLHLNIYVPNDIKPSQRLPVMVYIHGGAFFAGDGNFESLSPEFLIKHNVIIVTVNYRLGPYGFMCFKNANYSNQGLKDLVLSLQWIKDNIKNFNGDDDNVTVFGHSAGAINIDLILMYKERLFHKIIIQGGVATSPIIFGEVDKDLVRKIAEKLHYNGDFNNEDQIIEYLSKTDSVKLLGASGNEVFRPCIDGEFITKTPKANMSNIPILIGNAYKEGLFFYGTDETFYKKFDFKTVLAKGFDVNVTRTDWIKDFYLKDISNFKEQIISFSTDFLFNYPIERSLRYYLKYHQNIYRYLFKYDGGRNFVKIRDSIEGAGATHGDELGYLFQMDLFKGMNENDRRVVDVMTELWTNFAKYGDPTPSTSALIPERWEPVNAGSKAHMIIDSSLQLIRHPIERMAFWDDYYEMYEEKVKGIDLNLRKTKGGTEMNGLNKSVAELAANGGNFRSLSVFLTIFSLVRILV